MVGFIKSSQQLTGANNRLYRENSHKLPQFGCVKVMMRYGWRMSYGMTRV